MSKNIESMNVGISGNIADDKKKSFLPIPRE